MAAVKKDIFVAQLLEKGEENQEVQSTFLVVKKVLGSTQTHKAYLNLRLADRTGEIDARVWDRAEELSRLFGRGEVVRINGRVVAYQEARQLKVHDLTPLPAAEIRWGDYLPESRRDREEMFLTLRKLALTVKNPQVRKLLERFFLDDAFVDKFKECPAAKSLHHSYLGGLLEHTLAVAELVDAIGRRYPAANRDLLIAGAMLHDLGKTQELTWTPSFDYSTNGRLLGHISLGLLMVEEKIAGLGDFPPEYALALRHIMLSHHGHYEYGSPKRPKTLEALIIYYADDLDAKANAFDQAVEQNINGETGWSNYHKMFERYIFRDPRLPHSTAIAAEKDVEELEEPSLFPQD